MAVCVTWPRWQLKGTDLAADGCSTGRRPDVLPRMAPRGYLYHNTSTVCVSSVRSNSSPPWFGKWQLFLDDRRCFQGGEMDNFKWKSSWMRLKKYVSWGWTYGIEAWLPLELLIVHVPKGSEAHPNHRLSLSSPGMYPGRNHSTLISLDHCFSTSWCFARSPTSQGHWKCLETFCGYRCGVAVGM